MPPAPKPASDSLSEMVQVVLPNDANPLGYILGGTVMHLVDIAGAIAALRHTRTRVTCTFGTSLEVEVDVLSEETLTGVRQLTSHAFLTFVSVDGSGSRLPVPPLLIETDAERQQCEEAHARRAQRLMKRKDAGVT